MNSGTLLVTLFTKTYSTYEKEKTTASVFLYVPYHSKYSGTIGRHAFIVTMYGICSRKFDKDKVTS